MDANQAAARHDRTGYEDLTRGLQLAVIALASAVLTATLVIGTGGVLLERSIHAAAPHAEASESRILASH
jgi:hypothetical protein